MNDAQPTPVRVRFAPSPTGALHLGSALAALANAAFARSVGGTFVLRIDDTDLARSNDDDVFELLRLTRWLGIDWDEGPIHQSARAQVHREALDGLVARGQAYPCFCDAERLEAVRIAQERAGQPPRYDGRCRALGADEAARAVADGAPHVLRFAVPLGRDVSFQDLIHGQVTIPAGSFGDPVLCRTDGSPGYLLASVVDDVRLGITHIIRGEDHLTNSARQLLLFEALLEGPAPAFAHFPLLRDDEGRKLSKRAPLGTLDELVDEGFLPRTVRRYLAELLGQGPTDLLDLDEPSPRFLFDRVPSGAPRVDRARLESIGREDMAMLDVDTALEGSGIEADSSNEPVVRELAAASATRSALRNELRLVFDGPGPGDLPVLLAIGSDDDAAKLRVFDDSLELVVELLRSARDEGIDELSEEWAHDLVRDLRAEGRERGIAVRDLLRPLRLALTGTTNGPKLDLVLAAVGPADSLRRIHLGRIALEELTGGAEAVGG